MRMVKMVGIFLLLAQLLLKHGNLLGYEMLFKAM
jgi:hypothetical protein